MPPIPRAVRAAWWSAAGVWAAAILYGSVIPVPEGPEIPWLDKAAHAGQYLVLAWLLVRSLHAPPGAGRLAWLSATGYGALVELLQALIPWRSADPADALANAVGALVGAQLGTVSLTARDRFPFSRLGTTGKREAVPGGLMTSRWQLLLAEFAHHLPFTVVGSLIAMAAVWWFGTHALDGGGERLFAQARASFHLLHPLHVCLSAIATTSLFWRHERRLLRAAMVGVVGAIVPCGLSDYIFPYLGGRLLGQPMELHVCLVDHPQLFFPFLALGIVGGFWAEERLTGSHLFSHGAHIFVSSAASLLYLISFGFTAWMADVRFVFPAFLTVVLAVWVPCCISDIAVPTATTHGRDFSVPRAALQPGPRR